MRLATGLQTHEHKGDFCESKSQQRQPRDRAHPIIEEILTKDSIPRETRSQVSEPKQQKRMRPPESQEIKAKRRKRQIDPPR